MTFKKAQAVLIGSLYFKSKKQAKDYFREIKNRNKNKQLFNDDLNDVKELFIYGFEVDEAPNEFFVLPDGYGDFCFQYDDGKRLSFINAIDGQPSKLSRFNSACRESVKEQIFEFRRNNQTEDNQHVDHFNPYFSEIVDKFISGMNIDIEKVNLVEHDNIFNLPDDLKRKFRLWHKRKANLRMLSASSNLKLSYLARRV